MNFLGNGPLAVASFIAISGYSLTLPVLRNEFRTRSGVKEFYLSRWIRIVPPYYAAILLTLALIAADVALGKTVLSPTDLRHLGVATVKHLLLLQDIDARPLVVLPRWSSGIFWTVGVEFKIYLLFPALLWIVRRWGFAAAAGATLLIAAVLALLPQQNLTHKATYFVLFFLGMAACAYSRTRPIRFGVPLALASFALGFACIHTDPASSSRWVQAARDLGIGGATCGLMVALGGGGRLRRLFEIRPLVFLGTFSYSIYLVHGAFIQLALNANPFAAGRDSMGWTIAFRLAAVLFALVGARVFFVLCERPFFKKRHREAQKLLA